VLPGGLGFGAAAGSGGTRGDFIGWSPAERQAGLLLIVHNARFLRRRHRST
jgi:hypothetical protein